MFEGLRQKLSIVGELTVDQAGGQDHSSKHEHDLVLSHADAQDVVLCMGRDASELLQGASGDVDFKATGQWRLELRLLHAEAIGIGGHHLDLVSGGGDEDPCEHGACLVPRRGTGDLDGCLDERSRRQRYRSLQIGLGKRGKLSA